jgi:hypothetical protein
LKAELTVDPALHGQPNPSQRGQSSPRRTQPDGRMVCWRYNGGGHVSSSSFT